MLQGVLICLLSALSRCRPAASLAVVSDPSRPTISLARYQRVLGCVLHSPPAAEQRQGRTLVLLPLLQASVGCCERDRFLPGTVYYWFSSLKVVER